MKKGCVALLYETNSSSSIFVVSPQVCFLGRGEFHLYFQEIIGCCGIAMSILVQVCMTRGVYIYVIMYFEFSSHFQDYTLKQKIFLSSERGECQSPVVVITWCFTPSQPLRLYQGESVPRLGVQTHQPLDIWLSSLSLAMTYYLLGNSAKLVCTSECPL